MVRREAARPTALRRMVFPEGMEVREAAGAPTQIVGYAAVFGVEAHGEVIKKGAFKRSLAGERDVRAYWQHDTRFPLGRQSNGTLKLKEDARGLWCEITPNPETSWGRDALASVGRGDVQGMSFGFMPVTASEKVVQGQRVTELVEVELFEVSAVSEPWYEATTAAARDFNAEGAEGAEGRREEGEGQGAAGAAAGDKDRTEEAARAAAAGASASRLARLRALKVGRLKGFVD